MWRRTSCSVLLAAALAACGGDTGVTGPGGTIPENNALPASLSVTPESKTMAVGETLELLVSAATTEGLPCDCAPTYSSEDPAIATVSDHGVVTAKAAGEVWIKVTCVGGISVKVKIIVRTDLIVPVTLTVLPDLTDLLVGQTVQLSSIAKDINGLLCECLPTYVSENPAIATVSDKGLVTAKAAGEVWIKVTCVGGITVRVKIIVKVAVHTVTIEPVPDLLDLGATLQLKIVAKDINGLPCDCVPTYSSSDPSIATVSVTGLVTTKAAGEVYITVHCLGGVSAKVKIVVKAVVASVSLDPVSAQLKIGTTLKLAVIAKDINGLPVDCVCTFSSLDPLLATVSDLGLVTALLPGTLDIKATCEGISAKAKLTIVV